MTGRAAYWILRAARHACLAAGSTAVGAVVFHLLDSTDLLYRLSMATAYVGLALLVVALALGPLKVLRRRPSPVSTDLRRDVGIWAALVGTAHVVVGLQVHMHGRMWEYFLFASGQLRYDLFGLANWTGLAVGLVLLVLLVLSNDVSLRRLGATQWKAIQRWIYPGFAAFLVHGALYQVVERRHWPFVAVFGLLSGAAVAIQLAGVAAHRRADRRSLEFRNGENQPAGARPPERDAHRPHEA